MPTTEQPAVEARTATLLFTDVERSTEMVDLHGSLGTGALLRHHDLVRARVEAHGGRLFERIGDANYALFDEATDALAAASAIHAQLEQEDWAPVGRLRVRIALDTGPVVEQDGRYLGKALYRTARIQALARGGETLLSDATARQVGGLLPDGHRLRDLGERKLKGLASPVRIWGMVPVDVDARPIRVLLVDDYSVVRRGLRGFLELLPDIEVVGEATDGQDALAAVHRLAPDVVLMDLVMPGMDGADAIGALCREEGGPSVIALTSFADPRHIARARAAGAADCLLKDADAEELAAAVRRVAGRI